jgi:hypothetical protein
MYLWSMRTLARVSLCLTLVVACSRSSRSETASPASPSVTSVALGGQQVSVAVASSSLTFGGNGSLQLAFTSKGAGAPVKVTLERVAILDSSGAELQNMTISPPAMWQVSASEAANDSAGSRPADNQPALEMGGAAASADIASRSAKMAPRDPALYKLWDSMVGPNAVVKVSYMLSPTTPIKESAQKFVYRAFIVVEGKKLVVESPAFTRTPDIAT